jgi:membrane protease YdiL (CAAX protease family)
MAASSESILDPSGDGTAAATGLFTAAFAGLAVGLASVGVSEWLTRGTELGERLADLLGESLAGIKLGDAILLAIASGMAEEMLFRGALQPAVGIVWASLIFGACHFLPRRELVIWSLYAVVMGFAFGWLFEWTGQLLAPIVAHSVVNGINLPRLARRYENLGDD